MSAGGRPQDPPVPGGLIAGALHSRRKVWARIPHVPAFVCRWVRKGFSIPLTQFPPKLWLPNRPMPVDYQQFVERELQRLLDMKAIARLDKCPHIVSPIGVVPKKNGKLRLIIDLRRLNRYVEVPKFCMEDL